MTSRRATFPLRFLFVLSLAAGCTDLGVGLDGDWSIEYRDFTLRLAGTVVRAEDGMPVVGATVSGVWGVIAGAPALTDTEGRYSLIVTARCFASNCTGPSLMADLDSFAQGLEPQVSDPLPVPASASDTVTVDFSLRSLRPIELTVRGTVTEGTSGTPIPNATVTVREGLWPLNGVMGSTATDSVGAYQIVLADHCAVAQGSCVASLNIWAESGSRLEAQDFTDLAATGDSLVLQAHFTSLR